MIRAMCVSSKVIVSLNDRECVLQIPPDNEAPAALICKASPRDLQAPSRAATLAWRLCIDPGPTIESRDRDEPRRIHTMSEVVPQDKALTHDTSTLTSCHGHSALLCARWLAPANTRKSQNATGRIPCALHSPVRRRRLPDSDRWSNTPSTRQRREPAPLARVINMPAEIVPLLPSPSPC
jgi:hypothetical protein